MKRLLREEKIIVLCAVLFVLVCAGRYAMLAQRQVITFGTDAGITQLQTEQTREIPKSLIPGEKIDLNTASEKDLARLPWIEEERAREIVAWRERYGAFRTIRELKRIPGIDAGIYKQVEPYITVGGDR